MTFSYDSCKRWKGLIENAALSGDFTLEPVAMLGVCDAQGDRWEALDWKTITNLQKTVMQYGIENKLVRNQVTAIFKYTLLTSYDSKSIMEFILGPTSYMLWLNKWQAKLEEHMVENLDLPAGDPLRFTTLEQLMGTGAYRDVQRQAALHHRVLWQSQNAALATFLALPQIGTPLRPYTKIIQEPDEPFLKFVDRLREAIDMAPDVTPEL